MIEIRTFVHTSIIKNMNSNIYTHLYDYSFKMLPTIIRGMIFNIDTQRLCMYDGC